ncbi:MAG: SAM hydrolase/SAM-dependent halogenase family protein [Terasakiella sp.]|uniref:SAM hydrolase/SAM-dependent halogenase family protein n=1 Tax=unclassified Terasakiella TaxID=2614952 RepID=UPI003B008D64
MIVTFTDFGITGPYMGQMKARLLEYAPCEQIVDLMIDVPPFQISYGAKLLAGLLENMPKQAVYLCVVDPGVGGQRKPICLQCDGRWLVGPDNGLFHYIIQSSQNVQAFEILWRGETLSKSFHGRDLFAPIAAMLAQNIDFDKSTLKIDELVTLPEIQVREVIYIDVYGNCWTDIRHDDITTDEALMIGTSALKYADVFCDTEVGHAFWYFNSSGFVEIAVNQGNAAHFFGLMLGSQIKRN